MEVQINFLPYTHSFIKRLKTTESLLFLLYKYTYTDEQLESVNFKVNDLRFRLLFKVCIKGFVWEQDYDVLVELPVV